MFASFLGHLSFPGNPPKPHNSSTLPRNPSPRDRVKSHCLRQLPPPDPAPARPLRGIWLRAGGGGGFQPGNSPEARLFTSTAGGAPAPVAVPSAAPDGRLGEQLPSLPHESPSRRGGRNSRRFNADPHRLHRPHYRRSRLFGRLPSPGSRWKGGLKEGSRDCVHERHGHLAPPAPAPRS